MTRPSSASFAQFFPTAPKAARERALEREKARQEAAESPSSGLAERTIDGQSNPSAPPDDPAPSRSRRDTSVSAPSQTPADDIDPFRGDIPNTVGSESSSASMGSSFTNGSMRPNGLAAAKSSSYSHLTPLTTIDSPSFANGTHSTKQNPSNPSPYEKINGLALKTDTLRENSTAVDKSDILHRLPARDPSLSVHVIKATQDPSADRSSRDKKKPKYKEFGLVRKHIIHSSARQGERHLLIFGHG